MEIKTRTTVDMDFSEEEMKTLNNACTLFNEIEEDLRKYRDARIKIIFNETEYSYSDFNELSTLLCDMVDEYL